MSLPSLFSSFTLLVKPSCATKYHWRKSVQPVGEQHYRLWLLDPSSNSEEVPGQRPAMNLPVANWVMGTQVVSEDD